MQSLKVLQQGLGTYLPDIKHVSLLGAFAKLRKATISFAISVRPSTLTDFD